MVPFIMRTTCGDNVAIDLGFPWELVHMHACARTHTAKLIATDVEVSYVD